MSCSVGMLHIKLANRLVVGYRHNKIKDDISAFGLNDWKNVVWFGVVLSGMGKTGEVADYFGSGEGEYVS